MRRIWKQGLRLLGRSQRRLGTPEAILPLVLLVLLLTGVIFACVRDSLAVCLLALLPLALLAWVRGWQAGVFMGLFIAMLTAPTPGPGPLLLHPQLDVRPWAALSVCYVLLGALVGLQSIAIQRRQQELYARIEDELQRAQASAERYEALVGEMTEGQTRLQRMNDELALLNTIATAVNSSLDVSQVQETALTHLGTLLEVDAAQIFWLDVEEQHFVLQAARPLPPPPSASVRVTEGLLGRVMASQRAERIDAHEAIHLRPPTMDAEMRSIIATPLRSRSRLQGALVLGRKNGKVFTEDDEKFLESIGRILTVAIENARLFKEAHELSLSDELTGLANRRMFNLRLRAEISRARAGDHPLCLVIFDLDGFKQVNDRYGHLVGDAVLVQFARTVQQDIRGTDLFCRLGGDEFVLVAPDTTAHVTVAIVERICRRVAQTPYVLEDGNPLPIGVSAGVACLEAELSSSESLLALADRALADAKKNGRNRVNLYSPVTTTTAKAS